MATAAKNGIRAARVLGNTADCGGFQMYPIASGYSTSIFTGDLVKLSSGTIVKQTSNAQNDLLGVFIGVSYVKSDGVPTEAAYWPASATSTSEIKAKVIDNPFQVFRAKANGSVAQVKPGQLYAAEFNAGDTATGIGNIRVRTLAEVVGDVDISAVTDLGAGGLGITDGDTFTVRTSAGESATTITIAHADGYAELLAKLNAVANISASLTSAGYLKIQATNGYSLMFTEPGTGVTPITDLFPATYEGQTVVGTVTATATAANGAQFKVVDVIDTDLNILEVTLVNHAFRDDG